MARRFGRRALRLAVACAVFAALAPRAPAEPEPAARDAGAAEAGGEEAEPEGPAAAAAPWAVGDRIEPFELPDAHGEPGRVDESVRLLLFAADMDAGGLVNEALEGDPSLRDLAARGAVFVSDIHRMPAIVTRLFALPSMRRRPYRMLLDREEAGPTVRIPREEGRVTRIELDALAIRSISFLDSADAVARALRAAPPGPLP